MIVSRELYDFKTIVIFSTYTKRKYDTITIEFSFKTLALLLFLFSKRTIVKINRLKDKSSA